LSLQPAAVEKLAWVLIFGGMIVFTLGLFMLRGGGNSGGDALAWAFMVAAAVSTATGVVLIFVRARMRAPRDDKP